MRHYEISSETSCFTSMTEMATRNTQERPKALPGLWNPDAARKATGSSSRLIICKGAALAKPVLLQGGAGVGRKAEAVSVVVVLPVVGMRVSSS